MVFGDLGKIYLEQGNFIKARDYFEKAVEKDRDNMDALEILAEANEKVGDIVDALNDHIRLCEMRYHHFGSMDPLTKQSIENGKDLDG